MDGFAPAIVKRTLPFDPALFFEFTEQTGERRFLNAQPLS